MFAAAQQAAFEDAQSQNCDSVAYTQSQNHPHLSIRSEKT